MTDKTEKNKPEDMYAGYDDHVRDLEDEIAGLQSQLRTKSKRLTDGIMALTEAILEENTTAMKNQLAYLSSVDELWSEAVQRARRTIRETE